MYKLTGARRCSRCFPSGAPGRRVQLPATRSLGPRGGFLAQLDLDFGGDDLATGISRKTTARTSRRDKAWPSLPADTSGHVDDSAFEIDASIGYKYATTQADNADINVHAR